MHFSTSPVIGTIAIEPRSSADDTRLPLEADDSSLESLLASLLNGPSLASLHDRSWTTGLSSQEPACFIASGRLSRFGLFETGGHDAVRADLTRLFNDLEDEYDRLAMA